MHRLNVTNLVNGINSSDVNITLPCFIQISNLVLALVVSLALLDDDALLDNVDSIG